MRRPAAVMFVLALTGACDDGRPGGQDLPADADDDPAADAAPLGSYSADLQDCDDAADAIYVTPLLPPMTAATRGDVVWCSAGPVMTVNDVAAALDVAPGVSPTTGVRVYKIAYRTARAGGIGALTTATLWMPETPRELPAPVALVARSTSGLADACAPSRDENPLTDLGLPLAARGFVVVAPDFAGLGNEGVHAYLDNREGAEQLFDGRIASAKLAARGTIGDAVVAVGYSQGGGIVLSAQSLEAELAGGRNLRAVVAVAPEWPIRVGSFGYEDVLRNPDLPTGLAGLSPPGVAVLRQYSWFVNHIGDDHGGDSFPASERADLIDEIESLCLVELGAALGFQQPHLGDLVDEPFRAAMLACIDGQDVACTEPARSFHAWLEHNVVTADPAGAPVLVVQGLLDQIMPPLSEAACGVEKLRADGLDPAVCTDAGATHQTILKNRIAHAVAWAEAVYSGQPAPSCDSQFLPDCTL